MEGSGKTTFKKLWFGRYRDIDPDYIKRRHPKWNTALVKNNPRTDRKIHVWSVKEAVARLRNLVNRGVSCVLDASGSDCLWLRDQIQTATDGGFWVTLVYVVVPLQIALKRNRDRISGGGMRDDKEDSNGNSHFVPENIISSKVDGMRDSFSRARRYADEVWVVVNYDQKELSDVILE
eukprot:CAMPEP_0185282084 /NCGR_PEP_ID=MMETSP1359-20130426/67078_1 /TAXON_ID=552665 /ORGANISM="Bigelowiella longifila, Strain CCMP242" /LENGTH=177 /DNA_ID=CAMNT_0027877589 /DNA_START=552 /DNA_END=1085 /DNA_ORIENTATION=-